MQATHFTWATRWALAVVLFVAPSGAFAQAPPQTGAAQDSNFTIFLRGTAVGNEQVTVTRGTEGWTIIGSGRFGDAVARRLEVRYTDDWKPLELTYQASLRGEEQMVRTTVSGTTASSLLTRAGRASEKTDTIESQSILLASPFFTPYEALAIRLRDLPAGSILQGYTASVAPLRIVVGESSDERIQTLDRMIAARLTHVTIETAGDAAIWTDEDGRLLRLSVPGNGLEIVRDDIASVASRRVVLSRPNDEDVKIPANGFVLAGTISRPEHSAGIRLPAVILVGQSEGTDRDETTAGVPLFAELASSLADARFVVVRYDRRALGQSGGMSESATLADYADDVSAVVAMLRQRRDVDKFHIGVLGYADGGWVAMLAAARDKHIGGLVLAATPGVTGAEFNLWQSQRALEGLRKSDADKQATLELQKRIQHAVLTGSGWDQVPAELRAQADTPWFQSYLAFDPARIMPKIHVPMLIVHGMLDTEVEPSNAEALAVLARARKGKSPVELTRVPSVDHLLIAASTGLTEEYSQLTEKLINPAVTSAITDWLAKTFSPAISK
jgi:uncharacterized protein